MSDFEGVEFFIADPGEFKVRELDDVRLLWLGLIELSEQYPGQTPIYLLDTDE